MIIVRLNAYCDRIVDWQESVQLCQDQLRLITTLFRQRIPMRFQCIEYRLISTSTRTIDGERKRKPKLVLMIRYDLVVRG